MKKVFLYFLLVFVFISCTKNDTNSIISYTSNSANFSATNMQTLDIVQNNGILITNDIEKNTLHVKVGQTIKFCYTLPARFDSGNFYVLISFLGEEYSISKKPYEIEIPATRVSDGPEIAKCTARSDEWTAESKDEGYLYICIEE